MVRKARAAGLASACVLPGLSDRLLVVRPAGVIVVVEPAVRVVRRIARPSHPHPDDQLREQRDVVGLETSSVADIRIVGGLAGPM